MPTPLPLSPDLQRVCLQALGRAAEQIGRDVPLSRFTQAQALHLIDAVIHAYEHHIHARRLAECDVPAADDEDDDLPF